jgi:ABC-type polysaccharide/polyol phosphate export permease
MISLVRDLHRHRYMLWSLVRADLRQRYIGSSIGLFWSVINPLLLIFLYTFVFSVVLDVRVAGGGGAGSYGIFLFAGMLPWIAFHEAITKSSTVVLEHRGLVGSNQFPTVLLPLYVLVSSFLHELIAVGLFVLILLVLRRPPSPNVIGLFLVFPWQLLLTLGCCLIVSSLNVYFRDVAQLAQAFLLIWFFSTPIVYPIEAIPLWVRSYFYLNPLTPLIDLYRALLLGTPVNSHGVLYFLAFTVLVLLVGVKFFRRLSEDFTDFL